MGMAASQARLLSITARIHDVEYEAQAIQNAKVQLATLSDEANAEYLEALDATTLTLTSIDGAGNKSVVGATFNNLVSSNKLTPADGTQYALTYKGALIVENDVYDGYQKFQKTGYDQSAEVFALYMLGACNAKPAYEEIRKATYAVFKEHLAAGNLPSSIKSQYDKMLELNKFSFETEGAEDEYMVLYSDNHDTAITNKDKDEFDKASKTFFHKLYKTYCNEIYAKLNSSADETDELDMDKYNFYVSIYNQIQSYGGSCVPIKDFDEEGKAENNTEWLQSMVQCGKISIEKIKTDKDTGEVRTEGASPSSETSLDYTQTTSIDKTALAKAEAKYEHTLKQIDKKDKQYDLTLSKLETERSALTTEYDSVKKVIEDNIERTFGIFS